MRTNSLAKRNLHELFLFAISLAVYAGLSGCGGSSSIAPPSPPVPTFTTIDAPGAGSQGSQGTYAVGLESNGVVTGFFIDANNVSHGFERQTTGSYTQIDLFGAGTAAFQGTSVLGVNSSRSFRQLEVGCFRTHMLTVKLDAELALRGV